MAKKRKSMDFEALIQKGENPLGMTSQTPNGTAHWDGLGWNQEHGSAPSNTPAKAGGAWKRNRSNRTGE